MHLAKYSALLFHCYFVILLLLVLLLLFVLVHVLCLTLIFKLQKSILFIKTFNNILKLPDLCLRLSRSSFFLPPPFSGKRWGLGFGLEGFWLTDRKLHGIHQIKMAKLNLQNLKSIIYCSSYWSNLWSKYHTFLFPLIISH